MIRQLGLHRGLKRSFRPSHGPLFACALALAGCATPELRNLGTPPEIAEASARVELQRVGFAVTPGNLPPMRRFTSVTAPAPLRSNRAMTRDFLDLFFELETGTQLPVFTRFEGPITLRVTGSPIPAAVNVELSDLLSRLRREAKIDISRVGAADAASITIELISRAQMSRRDKNAACIVVPGISSWQAYRTGQGVKWASLTSRERISIFIPQGVAPQEMRDCLHEELAQAIGPLNDLYRLPDSTFNDDNINSVLTGFDMLMLRAAYAPELRSGMSRAQVAAILPALLDRLNPRGRSGGDAPTQATPLEWRALMARATVGNTRTARRLAAERALAFATARGWNDTRKGLAEYYVGRLLLASDIGSAARYLDAAAASFSGSRLTETYAANVARHRAALALVNGNNDAAFEIANTAIPAATRAQDAALLASLMLLKAESLARLGRASEAHVVRIDSLGWARYGFGSDAEVIARVEEISALAR